MGWGRTLQLYRLFSAQHRPLLHALCGQGWLYWATDLWRNCPSSPHSWQRQNITIMRRINGTAFTDFLAGSTIWCNQKLYDFWVNGDGYYM